MRDTYLLKTKEDALYEGDSEDPIIRGKLDALGFLLGETDPITDAEVAVPQSDEDLDKLIAVWKCYQPEFVNIMCEVEYEFRAIYVMVNTDTR